MVVLQILTCITMQVADSLIEQKTPDNIRFNNWSKKEWLDNEYIRTLRKYLDKYNNKEIHNENLDPFKEYVEGKFIVYDINPYLLGGVLLRIIFIDNPNRVFSCWIYSYVNEQKGIIEDYELRFINIEEEKNDMTKEDILEAIKEEPLLKQW